MLALLGGVALLMVISATIGWCFRGALTDIECRPTREAAEAVVASALWRPGHRQAEVDAAALARLRATLPVDR